MGGISDSTGDTVESLRAGALALDPTRPLLTFYDDHTGERVELSGVTLDNWVAKTANLLVDGCGLGRGDVATVVLPPHWQSAAVLLGCWAAGLSVRPIAPETPAPETGRDLLRLPCDVLFSAVPITTTAADRYFLGLAPMGLPSRDLPAGWLDYVTEVRGHGDRFTATSRVTPGDPATPQLRHARLAATAVARAAALGISGGRVLIDGDAHPDPLDWLLAPLAAGASVVLCRRLDHARLPARVAAENVDVVLAAAVA